MTDDFDAVVELASELHWADAARFVRSETGISLREAGHVCERIMRDYPNSKCGLSYADRIARLKAEAKV